jgi:hypothetical protein
MPRRIKTVLTTRGAHSRLKALKATGVGKGPDGYSIDMLFDVAEALAELKSTGNDAFVERARRPTKTIKAKQAKTRRANESARRREMKEHVAEVARERNRLRGRQWRADVSAGLLPQKFAGLLLVEPGTWWKRPDEVAPGHVHLWDKQGWIEKGERLPGTGMVRPWLEAPGRMTYRLTQEGEAAQAFAWWSAGLALLDWRRPVIGVQLELVAYWIRGEDAPWKGKGRVRPDRGVWPGDAEELAWPDFWKWPLGPREGV